MTTMIWFAIAPIIIILVIVLLHQEKPQAPANAQIILLPDNSALQSILEQLGRDIKERLDINVKIIEAKPFLNTRFYDKFKEQYQAHSAIDEIEAFYPDLSLSAHTLIIGITAKDLYAENYNGPFVFGAYSITQKRIAVISTARMGHDPRQLQKRLLKMVMRYAGIKLYGLGFNKKHISVLHETLRTLTDLDAMDTKF